MCLSPSLHLPSPIFFYSFVLKVHVHLLLSSYYSPSVYVSLFLFGFLSLLVYAYFYPHLILFRCLCACMYIGGSLSLSPSFSFSLSLYLPSPLHPVSPHDLHIHYIVMTEPCHNAINKPILTESRSHGTYPIQYSNSHPLKSSPEQGLTTGLSSVYQLIFTICTCSLTNSRRSAKTQSTGPLFSIMQRSSSVLNLYSFERGFPSYDRGFCTPKIK